MTAPKRKKVFRGWACVGTKGDIFATVISRDETKSGRYAIYTNPVDAQKNSVFHVVPVEITVEAKYDCRT